MAPNLRVHDTLNELDDCNIKSTKPLIPPQILMEEYPLNMQAAQAVLAGRRDTEDIMSGKQDRIIVVVGPCSVHDVRAGLDYAQKLRAYAEHAKDDLHIIMRVYFEKPRTTVGWKGLINDPNLDGTYEINKGLRLARGFLLEIAKMGLATGAEFLDTISPQYTADLISWGAIGARTTESQVHRELTSGLSMPVGFKNGTDGSVAIAVDAIKSASSEHSFLSVTKQGISAIIETAGNKNCHVILRGSNSGPNYAPEHVQSASAALEKAGIAPRIMIDCSHGNSEKKHENQVKVVDSVVEQLSRADDSARSIIGVMLESNIVQGKQSIPSSGPAALTYGQSITDACIGWDTTVAVLDKLREGVRARRDGTPPSLRFNVPMNEHVVQPSLGKPGVNDAALGMLGKQ
ncbi:3-deoxy-7-phosphoheptulonate synthase [Malassezia vespertilionis]|nr:3-deoxy-7-phosphoheptulonate synthase [Malassezia vespertilionis]WFD05607.1 3-deoxy-7-phosphoheptulonate synthase [Malassezia vespertilionis]